MAGAEIHQVSVDAGERWFLAGRKRSALAGVG